MIKPLKLLIFWKNPKFNWNVASGIASYSTKTIPHPSDNLLRRILPAGDPLVSIVPILDQWVQEGRSRNQSDLKTLSKSSGIANATPMLFRYAYGFNICKKLTFFVCLLVIFVDSFYLLNYDE